MKLTYWNGAGTYMETANQLQQLIPAEGAVENPRKNPKLEKFRKAVNCYYDLYNNGLCNRASQFSKVFGIRSSAYKERGYGSYSNRMYELVEEVMDDIVADAAMEQGIALSTQQVLDI